MTRKQKQAAAPKKPLRKTSPTQPERMKKGAKAVKPDIGDTFMVYLDYLLNLSAAGKRSNRYWNEMKDKLTEAGHWKKSYSK